MDNLDHLARSATHGPFLVVAIGFMLLEYGLSRLAHHDHDTHDLAETAATFGVAIGQKIVRVLEAGLVSLPYAFVYAHRLYDIDAASPLGLLALFLAIEFVYYWHHRASHRIRWMWATHAVHHTPTRMNMTAAIRLGWTGTISGNFLFFLPLVWIGFNPIAIVAMLGANLAYQFFIHTEFKPRLGPLEWVLNTPTHHRVHHAANRACIDKNYGGVLIVFDRLFGTFTAPPAGERLRYGVSGHAPSLNPLRIALGEWTAIWRDLRLAPTLSDKLRVMFAPPGRASRPVRSPKPISQGPHSTPASLIAAQGDRI